METGNNVSNSKKVTLSGLLLALVVITLFLATVSPVNEMSLYALSSFFVSVVIIELGIKAGWAFYAASCLLSLIIPNKVALIPYIVFFGLYGIVKFYIEKLSKLALEYILKLIFFNIFVAVTVLYLNQLIPEGFQRYSMWALILAAELVFVIYDYAYTLFIQYYRHRIRNRLRM